ncbi:MAG: HAD-IA family hydrolase [Acidobacteria bacterium]|nr:HAD-IA family hydrolase [Acidobacteriota bacterium]MBI3280801.1 HAD-IA family hydrolase [Acidobacteriota bacterium]
MIKTIIFDLGKVIVPFDFQRGYDRMASICPYSPEEIPARLRSCGIVTRFESGQMEPRAFVEEVSGILGLRTGYDEFCEIFSAIFLPETLIPEEMLAGLRGRYRLLLLSNTNAIHFAMVERNYPLLRHFDDYVLSFRVGALKPSPKIYREALRLAACEPGECFFTDDIAAYVEAAKNEGIDAVQFESREQIERELRARRVDW